MSVTLEQRWPMAVPRPAASARFGLEGKILLAYAALLPYQIEVAPTLRIAPADGCLILAAIVGAASISYRRHGWSVWHWGVLLTFAIGSLVAAFDSGELSDYVLLNKGLGLLLLFFSYLLLTSTASNWDHIRQLMRAFIVSVVLQNVVGLGAFLLAYFSGIETPLTAYDGSRLVGMMVDPNAYGGLLVLTLVLCEGTSSNSAPLLSGWRLIFCRLTLGLGILFTFSRTAWLSLGLVIILLLIARTRTAMTLLLGGATLAILFVAAGDRFLLFLQEMATRPENVRGRFELMESAFSQFARNPVFGGGLGSFIEMEGTIVHNTPLWFLTDFGLFGFFTLLGFVCWFLIKGLCARRLAPQTEKPVVVALLLGHVAMFSVGMGIEAFYQRHWWFTLALIASSYSIVARKRHRVLLDVYSSVPATGASRAAAITRGT